MQVSIPSYTLGNPTVYEVVVTTDSGQIQLTKRFNDFQKLAADFKDELDEDLPVPLPPKPWFGGGNTPEFCQQRRHDLEVVLRAIVRNVEYARALCVVEFLKLSQSRAPQDWLQLSSKVADLIAKAKAASGTERRKLCLEAKTWMAQLRNMRAAAGDGEHQRRQAVVEDFARQIATLETIKKEAVFTPSSRVLGETDATRALNNGQLMAQQQVSMADQDAQVEGLRVALARQRALGTAIDEELQSQNALLEDLDAQVHHTNSRVNQARRKTAGLR